MNVVFKSDDPEKIEEHYLRWVQIRSPKNEVFVAISSSRHHVPEIVTVRTGERVLHESQGIRLLTLDEFRLLQQKYLESEATAV